MADRVDAAVLAVQPTVVAPDPDQPAVRTGLLQLPRRHATVLPAGDPGDRGEYVAHT